MRRHFNVWLLVAIALTPALLLSGPAAAQTDWPQLQKDAARTGRTSDSVSGPYRVRWMWFGPNETLQSEDSETGWPDDLDSRSGYSFPMPSSVSYTIAQPVQPVLADGQVFIGTLEGGAYGIDAFDGTTDWSASITGGTVCSAAVSEDGAVVVFATLSGKVYGFDVDDGSQVWSVQCRKAILGAPCVKGGLVYVADVSGRVYAIETADGDVAWTTRLVAPVHGGIAADSTSLYVGAENMYVYALDLDDGDIRTSHRVKGQSFRQLWPVVFNSKVWVSSVTTPIIGSEYVMETLMAQSGSFSVEETNIALWLQGDTTWSDSGVDWQHLFALNTSDLSEPFTILAGPADGCGTACEPPVVDNSDRVVAYFKTRYPTLAPTGAFGTNYSIDIAAINQTNGHRIQIDNSQQALLWPWETDNLYCMSVGGNILWLRQNFRGTQQVNLSNSSSRKVQVQIRTRDGGDFSQYDIYYKEASPEVGTAERTVQGRAAPIIVGDTVYFTETYCLTAIEQDN